MNEPSSSWAQEKITCGSVSVCMYLCVCVCMYVSVLAVSSSLPPYLPSSWLLFSFLFNSGLKFPDYFTVQKLMSFEGT